MTFFRHFPVYSLVLLGCGGAEPGEASTENGGLASGGQSPAGNDDDGEGDGAGGGGSQSELPPSIFEGIEEEPLYDFCSDAEVHQLSFDVAGSASLAEVIDAERSMLSSLTSLAIVLENGTSLVEEDLQTVARINEAQGDGGAGLTELSSLGLCNLESLSTEAFRDLDLGWIEHLYLDDLLEVLPFTFAGSDNGTTSSFKSVSMNSVLHIGEAAFQWGSLESLMLPEVVSIEKDAFRDNYRMIEILLPKVETLADAVFDDNTHLIRATFPELVMVGRNVFDDNHLLVEINMPQVTYLGKSFFGSCWALESVHFPSVETVDDNAFDNCQRLTSVSLPNALDVRNRAFSECVSLRELSLPRVTNFMNDVFSTCSGTGGPVPNECCQLERIHLPVVESLGTNTFGGCSELRSVILGQAPPSVGEGAFDGTGDNLSIYHSGESTDWQNFVSEGNASAVVASCSDVPAETCSL